MVSGRLSMNKVNINSRNKVKELEVFSKSTTQMEKERTQLQELFRFLVWSVSGNTSQAISSSPVCRPSYLGLLAIALRLLVFI